MVKTTIPLHRDGDVFVKRIAQAKSNIKSSTVDTQAGQALVYGANSPGGDVLEPEYVLDVIRRAADRKTKNKNQNPSDQIDKGSNY